MNPKLNLKLHLKLPDLKKNGRFLGFGSSAKRDWKIIFFTALTLLLVEVLVAVDVFLMLDKSDIFAETRPTTTEVPITASMLKNVTSYYEAKGQKLNDILKTRETIPDPSL